ncbi:hypothetical protein GJAV_G00127320 [Gymnothorax javanicus]|nr:hypothetical protein GJAV_G00127320 [Gymnothorax javanicus]
MFDNCTWFSLVYSNGWEKAVKNIRVLNSKKPVFCQILLPIKICYLAVLRLRKPKILGSISSLTSQVSSNIVNIRLFSVRLSTCKRIHICMYTLGFP